MITVKKIEAPSMKIVDKEPNKSGKPGKLSKPSKPTKVVKFELPKIVEKRTLETATYSTIIVVDGKYISLSVTKHLGYQAPHHLNHKLPIPKRTPFSKSKDGDLFEELFYWPLESFMNPNWPLKTFEKPTSLIYKMILESGYHYQSGLIYELNWEVIELEINSKSFTISSKEKSYVGAIPSNGSGTSRYDYIFDNGHYKYDCKPGEYAGRALEIIVTNKFSKLKYSRKYPQFRGYLVSLNGVVQTFYGDSFSKKFKSKFKPGY